MTASLGTSDLAKALPFTKVGVAVAVSGAVAYIAGWQLGWIEAMVLAAGCLLALLIALPFVLGRLRLDVVRSMNPDRVVVGDKAVATLRISNPRSVPSGRKIVEETVGSTRRSVDVPTLGPDKHIDSVYTLPTDRRGTVQVGPTLIARADPLRLMRREVVQTDADTLWVHPHIVALQALPVGFAKDLEGPTSDTSPAGDIAFHTIREYEPGDDYRHIHWLSSARTGDLMVRHYVDNRRPHLTVVLDTQVDRYAGDSFEEAVRIVASLGRASLLHEQPIGVFASTGVQLGPGTSRSPVDYLDRMTVLDTTDSVDLIDLAQRSLQLDSGSSALVLVTGSAHAEELLPLVKAVRRRARVIVTRVWEEDDLRPGVLPDARLIDVSSAEMFRAAWDGLST